MKKKKAEIRKEGPRPKLDRARYEALVAELSRPERLVQEAARLAQRLRDEPALLDMRFAPAALAAAALAEAASGRDARNQAAHVVAALVSDDLRARLGETLDRLARRTGPLEGLLPYRVGRFLLEAEMGGKVDVGRNALWVGVLQASALEAPIALYVRERGPASPALRAELAAGRAGEGLARFLADDARAQALSALVGGADLEAMLIHATLGFDEVREIALPFEAALRGPIEAARAAKRRQALVGVGRPASREEESMRVISSALEKDRARAVPAFRALLLERWDGAAPAAEPGGSGLTRAERIFAALVALEVLPPARNLPLLAAYESAGPAAVEEADEKEKGLLHAVLARPLEPAGYAAYARELAARDERARAAAFAEAALEALGEDAGLRAALEAARGGAA